MIILTRGKMTVTIAQGDFISLECSGGDSQIIQWNEFPENSEALEWILNFALSVAQSVSFDKNSITSCQSSSLPCYLRSRSTRGCQCLSLAAA